MNSKDRMQIEIEIEKSPSTSIFQKNPDPISYDTPHCLICLESLQTKSRALLPNCKHSLYCLECIIQWISTPIIQPIHRANQQNDDESIERDQDGNKLINTRTCPLCKIPIGKFILYDVFSDQDYRKYWLRPPNVTTSNHPQDGNRNLDRHHAGRINRYQRPHVVSREGDSSDWGPNLDQSQRRRRLQERKWEKSLDFRREVYRRGLYALHLGSNRHSRQRSIPTPDIFSTSSQEQRRAMNFIRREFWSWPAEGLDCEWLTNYVLAIMKEIPLRSDSAIRLLSDFLGPKGAEHFVHELYCFLRSPFGYEEGGKGLERYDDFVKYRLENGSSRSERSRNCQERDRGEGSSRMLDSEGLNSKSRSRSRINSRSSSPNRNEQNRSRARKPSLEAQPPLSALNEEADHPTRERISNLREKLLSRLEEERRTFSSPAQGQVGEEDKDKKEADEKDEECNRSRRKGKQVDRPSHQFLSSASPSSSYSSTMEQVGRGEGGYSIKGIGSSSSSDNASSDQIVTYKPNLSVDHSISSITNSREKLLAKLLVEKRSLKEKEKEKG